MAVSLTRLLRQLKTAPVPYLHPAMFKTLSSMGISDEQLSPGTTTVHAHTYTQHTQTDRVSPKGPLGFFHNLMMENPHQLSGQPIISRTVTSKFESALK